MREWAIIYEVCIRKFGWSQATVDDTEAWVAAQALGLHDTPDTDSSPQAFEDESLRLIRERMAAAGQAEGSAVGVSPAMMDAFRDRKKAGGGTP